MLTFNRGTRDGVKRGARGWLESRRKRVANGTFVVVRVTATTSVARVGLLPKQVPSFLVARIRVSAIGSTPNKCANFVPPCRTDAQCPAGKRCDRTGCNPSSCGCDPKTGRVICTADCSGGRCVAGGKGGITSLRIIRVTSVRGGSVVVFNRGARHGVKRGARGFLLDKRGRRIAGSGFRIVKVGPLRSEARVRLVSKSIMSGSRRGVLVP